MLFIGMGSAIAFSEELSQAEQRARAFDDTPVRTPTPGPTPTPGYKSYQNQGLGKMEMLEEVDKHLANMTKNLSLMNERLSKLEEMVKNIPQDLDQIKNTELPAIKKQLTSSPAGSGSGDGDIKDVKAKVEELYSTSVPNLQFELSLMKDTIRTMEAMVSTMDPLKGKGPVGGLSIEQDKKKAP
ncbi:MAG: hypothetical protein A2X86_14975 [Bdellovibrionales bacterium GWA2_49_15]|nr:MAG: hypothetical protein A2X86_14975 [Bdellovibrionales bacterium GWA2_49_15]HAZ13354.1 hypothetical protein [Bdellovibrionales bacterium]